MKSPEEFLRELYGPEIRPAKATDLIFDYMDRLLLEGCFGDADAVLAKADLTRLSPYSLRSLLCITCAAKSKLLSRKAFFAKVREQLVRQRGIEMANKLLRFLE